MSEYICAAKREGGAARSCGWAWVEVYELGGMQGACYPRNILRFSNMMRPLIVALLFVGGILASCTCGGPAIPCNSSRDCPANGPCLSGYCENSGTHLGDGGTIHYPDGGCVGLQCQQAVCPGSTKTTLTGTVFTPAGDLPLYNAVVYVPNGPVQPFPTGGVTCDRCGAVTSGDPLVSTLTGPDGRFRLENVPAGQNIPLVIQMGKWRRQITIPSITACQQKELDVGSTRLPRNKSEGDIPKIAIATGGADPFECLLRKVGIADDEITEPTGTGRVHFYRAHNGKDLASTAPRSDQLWQSLDTLMQYDMVLLPCEGTANTTDPTKTDAGKQNVVDYTTAGGRVFATHYSYTCIQGAPSASLFPSVANWNLSGQDPVSPYTNPFDVTVDTSFPKGSAFADWLLNVQASSIRGTLTLRETRHN